MRYLIPHNSQHRNTNDIYTHDNIIGATALGTDTYTVTYNPSPALYIINQKFLIKFVNSNTGAATLNVNGLGAKPIKKNVSSALEAGNIAAGQILLLAYDGTNFQIIGLPTTAIDFDSLSDSDVTALADLLRPKFFGE